MPPTDRRDLLKIAVGAAGMALTPAFAARPLTEKEKLARIASNTWPVRQLFKTRASSRRPNPAAEEMKKKYGEITLLDFPQFTKDTFPGVHHMDLFSGLFGDFSDDSMYAQQTMTFGQNQRTVYEFDPSSPSGRKWLETMAAKAAKAGVKCHHISNNAPRDISDLDPEKRKAGVEVAKKWLDGAAILGVKSMRVNTGGPRIAPNATVTRDYPRNDEIVVYLKNAVESFKAMADHGAKRGVKVTIENHWGLSANPANIIIILNEVKSPFCEASPDFCNWEHDYLLYHGLEMLTPYAHTTAHAKYWDRWKDNNDVRRSVQVMTKAGYKGIFALEYEEGPWDGVEGSKYLYKEVLAAL